MSHKKAKKERKLMKAMDLVAIGLEPIVKQAVAELNGDRERFKEWAFLATLLVIEDRGAKPIEEYLPSKLGVSVKPAVFMSHTNEYRP